MDGYEYSLAEKAALQDKKKSLAPIVVEPDNIGISGRTIRDFYKQRDKALSLKDKDISLFVSFFQLYNEQIIDLLSIQESKGM